MRYKSGGSIEIKQLKKLNKFKKRPSELCPSNQKMNPPPIPFQNLKIIKFKDIPAYTVRENPHLGQLV